MRRGVLVIALIAAVAASVVLTRHDDRSARSNKVTLEVATPQPSETDVSAPPGESPSDIRAREAYRKAEKLAQKGQVEEGLKILDKIVETESESSYAPFALYQKANWLYYSGKTDEARKTYELVQKRFPKSYLSIRAGEKIAELDLRQKRLQAILSNENPKPIRMEGSDRDDSSPSADCGPECLLEACTDLGVKATKTELKALAKTNGRGTTMLNLAKAARAKGLQAKGKLVNYQYLQEMQKPVIAWVNGNHYVLIKDVAGNSLTVYDPNEGQRLVPRTEFCQGWQGHVLALSLGKRGGAAN